VAITFRFAGQDRTLSSDEAHWLLGHVRTARELTPAAAAVAAKIEQGLEENGVVETTLTEKRELIEASAETRSHARTKSVYTRLSTPRRTSKSSRRPSGHAQRGASASGSLIEQAAREENWTDPDRQHCSRMLRQAFEKSFQVTEIQRNVNGEREGSRGRSPFARHRQRSERSANFCRTSNKPRQPPRSSLLRTVEPFALDARARISRELHRRQPSPWQSRSRRRKEAARGGKQ